MEYTLEIARKKIVVAENAVDRIVRVFDPVRANRRLRSRLSMAIVGGYFGGSKTRRAMKTWNPPASDADAAILFDLLTLRERSRDLVRNAPIAAGAINTNVVNVVGTGLKLHSEIDAGVLGLSEDEAQAWEKAAEREWQLWSESKECDAARKLTFPEIQNLSYRQVLESGDVFIAIPRFKRGNFPYQTKLQVVEADRVCNEGGGQDTEEITAGIKKDSNGAPELYYISKTHPGSSYANLKREWDKVPAYGPNSGLPNILHLYHILRPGQTRGVPYLAPVIEPLKQLDRYTEAEITAAVISAAFTVFIENSTGEVEVPEMAGAGEGTKGKSGDQDIKLAPGAIVGLANGEKASFANPGRPNQAFDPFVMAILRQAGAALGLPYEILIQHFTSSYSAARAALLTAWKCFSCAREWICINLCQPVYEIVLYEAIASGQLVAPGFFENALIRKAYCGATWTGPARGMIDEVKEVSAATQRIAATISTLEEETSQLTGGSWEKKLPQRAREIKLLEKNKIPVPGAAPATTTPLVPVLPDGQEEP